MTHFAELQVLYSHLKKVKEPSGFIIVNILSYCSGALTQVAETLLLEHGRVDAAIQMYTECHKLVTQAHFPPSSDDETHMLKR